MAKKDNNDELEDNDNINRDSNDDFNEADDSFGLPDVEYQPINRDEEEEYREEEVEESDTTEEVHRETTYYSETEETYTTETTDEHEDTYADDTYAHENDESVYASRYEEPPVGDEHAYVPGSYKPPKDDSIIPKVLGAIFVVLLVAVAIWYLGFYRPAEKEKERAKIEQREKMAQQKKREREAQEERERLEREEAARAEQERLEAEAAEPKIGTIETISSRTGRYHVVIASAIDEDLAMDHAKKMVKDGVNISIIEPFGKSKFHRIAVESHDSWAAAESAASDLRGQYGDGVWVIKY